MVKGDDAHWVFGETGVHVLLLGDDSKHWDPHHPTETKTERRWGTKLRHEQSIKDQSVLLIHGVFDGSPPLFKLTFATCDLMPPLFSPCFPAVSRCDEVA